MESIAEFMRNQKMAGFAGSCLTTQPRAEVANQAIGGALISAELRQLGTLNGEEQQGELAPCLWSQGLPLADQQIGRGGSH